MISWASTIGLTFFSVVSMLFGKWGSGVLEHWSDRVRGVLVSLYALLQYSIGLFYDIMLTFVSTSVVETICRLRFISLGSKPRAKPTNCGKWRIGRSISFPVCASALDWLPSKFRWQRGQGVTMKSAPFSLDSPVCFATIAKEFSSLA